MEQNKFKVAKILLETENGKLYAYDKDVAEFLMNEEKEVKHLRCMLPNISKPTVEELMLKEFLWTGERYDQGYDAITQYTNVKCPHYSGCMLKGKLPNKR